jgi:aquaporin Z
MPEASWKPLAAEFFGTFILVFVGTTAIVGAERANPAIPVLLVAPFAFGLGLLAALYAFGEVSGGHFNPAVSFAMAIDRRIDAVTAVAYWIVQFAGAISASLVLLGISDKLSVASTATKPFAGNGSAFVVETVFTAIFILAILQASRSSSLFNSTALIAIPLTLLAIHFAAIPFSGSSVNPARSFGPDLVGSTWTGIWIYLTAPFLGAAIAAVVHWVVVKEPEPAPAGGATAES